MIKKDVVERYLRANGVHPTAPDEQIKEVLFSAKWHEDDIDTALMVLREDPATHETHVDSLHKVFHSDERLQPETISALLGIEVDIKPPEERQRSNRVATSSVMTMTVVALSLSFVFVMTAMWYLKMGIFYSG
ncbi:hypothetical protein CL655_03400 [bacterium]|nr:hypothetical protein [bacterium]|tara:strand:+ start:6419 stop:6817 length:399 start_codon:yes stop_codon:yes gene_type:complete